MLRLLVALWWGYLCSCDPPPNGRELLHPLGIAAGPEVSPGTRGTIMCSE